MAILRPARETDLEAIYRVVYINDVNDVDDPPPPPPGHLTALAHILREGRLALAEEDGQVVAFAGAITRGDVHYLTDLFVLPDLQSAQLGKGLLEQVMPRDGRVRCTMSSTDPRALALYIRSGMQPQWPHFDLRLTDPLPANFPASDVEIVEGQADDPAFVEWDEQISGRWRPQEHALWVRDW